MNKDFRLDIKSVSEDGSFEGMLSVYNVVDLGNDLVEPGAFTKTIQENGGRVPLLWQHKTDEPIGELKLEDTPQGLKVFGQFILEVSKAKEAYALAKAGIIKGLSIGYSVIPGKSQLVKGIRHLKELRLLEGSFVTFPMNTLANITSVKDRGAKSDFITELEEAQIYRARCMMSSALECALDSIVWDMAMDRDQKVQAAADSIDQFKASYLELLPKLFDLWGEKADATAETKVGRRLSAQSRSAVEESISNLQALLTEEAASTSIEAASTPPPEAAKSQEPDDLHSKLADFLAAFKKKLGDL